MTPVSYSKWLGHLESSGPKMSSAEMEACGRLATVLLCGEQSAIQIFSAERERGRAAAAALNALRSIEFDELLHEKALMALCRYLPVPDDAHHLRRRSQRFFARFGRIADMAKHFGYIADLDSAVCKIMWQIERSTVDRLSPIKLIAAQIKADEARHVLVSRQYSSALGESRRNGKETSIEIAESLIEMLAPLGCSFEVLGVDSDRLFEKIRGGRLL